MKTLAASFGPFVATLVVAALVVSTLAFPARLAACDCVTPTVEEGFARADLVFRGRVRSIDVGDVRSFAHFDVEASWKGHVTPRLSVEMDLTESCTYVFDEGDYIVYADAAFPDEGCELGPYRIQASICNRTDLARQEEVEALGPPRWRFPAAEFLRGDSNSDLSVDISDALATLGHLFLGLAAPSCLDAADADDSGRVIIGDAVYTLNWLVLGGPPPPPPGPRPPAGLDPSLDELDCGEDFGLVCDGQRTQSSIPPVRIEIVDAPCTLTRDEARRGAVFTYRTIVRERVDVVTRPTGSCQQPGAAGLYTLGRVDGNEQSFCLCDLGRCAFEERRATLEPGTFVDTFTWCGRNWSGPSDFGNPPGAPFPSGTYTFRLESVGTWQGGRAFRVSAELPIELTD